VAPDRAIDAPLIGAGCASNHRAIYALDRMLVKLLGEVPMSFVALGGNQHTRGSSIQSVDDSRSLHSTNPGQVVAMMKQSVNECSARVSRSGMDNHPGRLVDDDQIFILVENIESNCLGLERRLGEIRRRRVESVALPYGLTGSTGAIVDANAIGVDPAPSLRARDSRDLGERAVESLTGFGLADDEVEDCHGGANRGSLWEIQRLSKNRPFRRAPRPLSNLFI
jgi:hypothetical protein